MQAMGVAFSASLFGVLGSLIMGVLMVSVRSAAGDLVSMVQSRVSLVVDATETDEATNDMKILSRALGELAQHSPILQGLAVALDQSERRVREVLGAVSQLTACVDDNTRSGVQVLEAIKQGAQTQTLSRLAIEQVQQDFAKLLQLQATSEQQNSQLAQVIVKQQSNIDSLIKTHSTPNNKLHQHQVTLMQQQETLWRDQGNTLRNQTDQQQLFWEEMLMQNETAMALVRKTAREQTVLDREQWNQQFGLQEAALEQARQQAREQVQADRSVWQQQMQKREQELNLAFKNMTVQADTERQLWLSQSQSWNESITHSHASMQALLERSLTEQIGQWTQLQSKLQQDQTNTVQFLSEFSALLSESTQTLRMDSRARTEFANQFHMHLSESQTRQEQLMHVLTTTVAQATKAP
jgi:hypothetical protein